MIKCSHKNPPFVHAVGKFAQLAAAAAPVASEIDFRRHLPFVVLKCGELRLQLLFLLLLLLLLLPQLGDIPQS